MRGRSRTWLAARARGFVVALAVGALCGAASADETPWWRTTPPGATSPSTPGSGWTSTGGGNFTVDLAPGASLWIGMENFNQSNEQKTVDLVMNQVTGDPMHPSSTRWLAAREVVGVSPPNPNKPGHKAIDANEFLADPPYRHLCMVFEPCPSWEYVRFENISSDPESFRLYVQIDTECSTKRRSASIGLPSDTFEVESGSFGVPGQTLGPQRITQMQIFPEFVELDLVSAAPIDVMPHTGSWSVDPIFVTPFGDFMPFGGWSFTSDGPGLMPTDEYGFSIKMTDIASSQYRVFAFDADAGRWQSYLFDLLGVPWWDRFDLYTDGDGAVGQGGWTGWDDDPAFDAPVSPEQALSPPHSVKVEGDADIVREFEGADSGFWTFEAWQYIPSDFASGGVDQFAGSYFNILNTYAGTGVSDWSVQIQIDGNDGMLKVFHGDGVDTIDVPYETDRWVKIQTEIDLENDWTRVYYDDELVTEYTWTGGVLGDGGGALDIAAVDLFAQGSSPIFYDDLCLLPVSTHCVADLAEPFGSYDFSDVVAFLTAFAGFDSAADLAEPFGQWDFSDVVAFLTAFGEGCP